MQECGGRGRSGGRKASSRLAILLMKVISRSALYTSFSIRATCHFCVSASADTSAAKIGTSGDTEHRAGKAQHEEPSPLRTPKPPDTSAAVPESVRVKNSLVTVPDSGRAADLSRQCTRRSECKSERREAEGQAPRECCVKGEPCAARARIVAAHGWKRSYARS